MAESTDLRDPWLVAVWPGMGSVALLAGTYLLQQLQPQRSAEINAPDFFEVQNVDVRDGLVEPGRLPRSLFFEWKNPTGGRDLLLFIGEAQPTVGGYSLCQKVLDYAIDRGVQRFFTFAAMATQLHPGSRPRVFAVATDKPSLKMASKLDLVMLEEGQITGLNGVLLAAGAERGLHGTCLMGELPFFAVGVPNPSAAQAVLERFTKLADIEIDFTELERQAEAVEQNLLELLEQMTRAAGEASEAMEEEDEEEPIATASPQPEPPQPPKLDPRTRRRIESLFDRAKQDRSRAFELKQELDRLGVFKEYEDRFLDLFRKAE